MDALRLIMATRGALARARDPASIMAEAWQAQALAQAMGSRLAVGGPLELRGEALSLTEVSGRGCGVLTASAPGIEAIRAAQLTEVGDASASLAGLGGLLGEVGIALVGVSCSAEAAAQTYYWNCVEAIDAADESRDRVLEMLRRLALREARREGEQGLPAPDSTAGPP
ncbi:DUF6099 family protein [Streptomyces boluensis]|uniref:Uncharacterized protein n=1 Tax=Streptomyces boluensis TaxID=1775135 RepID=A0A964UTY1_9ACTN|nr:DUF6099 family protein [Streptomyces boluensis]NBE55379.1 hypothetical protein [Streptomyces boluensis]